MGDNRAPASHPSATKLSGWDLAPFAQVKRSAPGDAQPLAFEKLGNLIGPLQQIAGKLSGSSIVHSTRPRGCDLEILSIPAIKRNYNSRIALIPNRYKFLFPYIPGNFR